LFITRIARNYGRTAARRGTAAVTFPIAPLTVHLPDLVTETAAGTVVMVAVVTAEETAAEAAVAVAAEIDVRITTGLPASTPARAYRC